MNIIIVEDNPAIRRMLILAIDGAGTPVACCGDGTEALAAYLKHRPALIRAIAAP